MSWQKVLDCIRVLLPKMSGILHFPIFIISRSISFRSPSSIDRRFWSNRMASTKNSDTAATTKSGDLQEPNQRGHCGRCCCPSSRASCSGRLLLLGGSRSRNNNNKSRCSSVVEQPTAKLIAALSILLLSLLADDGVAFRHQPSLPLLGRVARIANYRISHSPFQKSATSSTSLRYKNSSDGDLPNSQKRKRRLRPSKKKYKASRKQRVVRSYQLHKKGVPVSKEELAHHVQSVFSDLREFEREFEGEEEADAEPCILPEPDEDGSQQRQQQLDNCRKLDRHPALVLNADYQVCHSLCVYFNQCICSHLVVLCMVERMRPH
mmetsp:Transcript_24071/g.52029  ORF Transcript_24071/g.52029 Transcript_24071/m.52029 type:complete len:321 (-) Transcript_24071:1158-2120(-)